MEERAVRSSLVLCLVFGLLVGQSAASFQECYEYCFLFCIIVPTNSIFNCSMKCLKDCILPTPPKYELHSNTKYFCKLGCATSLCTNISTKQNPGGKKVESCVNSCSETCSKS